MYDSHSSLSTVGRWALESKIDFPSRADFVAASRKGNSSLAPASARTTLTLGSAYATWFPVSLPTRQFPYAVTRLFIPPLGESAFSNYVRMARRYSYEESARVPRLQGLEDALVLGPGLAQHPPGGTPGGQAAYRLLPATRILRLRDLTGQPPAASRRWTTATGCST